MGISKKIKKRICIGAAVLLAIPVLTHNPVYYRLYPGSKIKANIQVFVDGEKYKLNESNFRFTDFEDHNGKVSVNLWNAAKVKFRANEKSNYSFDIVGTPINQPISISFFKNCWNINRTDIRIDIDTSAETLTFRSEHTEVQQNEIFRSTSERTETVYYNKPVEDSISKRNPCSLGFGP